MTERELSTKELKQRAGHQEILVETLAKFEFFQHCWHPYSRFLDVDKVDIILRRRLSNEIVYREVQVKFGKLYPCTSRWELRLFSHTSWRFFTDSDLDGLARQKGLFLAYVLSPDDGFKGDMFIFPIEGFCGIIKHSHRSNNGNYRVCIPRTEGDTPRWYVRRRPKFETLDNDAVINVTAHYRNFACLER